MAVPAIFVIIELLAIGYYASSTSFTRARLLTMSNRVTGSVNELFGNIGDYFGFRGENEVLIQRVVELENQLAAYVENPEFVHIPAEEFEPYYFAEAKVIRNTVFSQHNYFTINKGLRDDVEGNMAVLSPEGYVVGYVKDCSENYAVCVSVANVDFSMGGKGRHNDYMGSIAWDGDDYREVALETIPHYANFSKGDTIVSTVSKIFPPDRIIGFVEEFTPTEDKMNSNLRVRLAADLSQLDRVVLVKFLSGEELEDLTEAYK